MQQPPRGDLWLRVNYWTLANLSLLRKWWVIILLGATTFFVVFAITNAVIFIISVPRHSGLIASLSTSPIDYQEFRSMLAPIPLDLGVPLRVSSGSMTDIAVKVNNANEHWIAKSFLVSLTADGKELGVAEGFLLPQQESYATLYSQTLPTATTAQKLEAKLVQVRWLRSPGQVSASDIFSISPGTYTRVEQTRPVRTVGTVTAEVTNTTLDGFWEVRFIVALFRSGSLVGIHRVAIDRFEPRSMRTLSAQWSPAPAIVDTIQIIPEVNPLDADALMPR